nr:MAG TPA: protein NinB [Caudoviricetes sp.]
MKFTIRRQEDKQAVQSYLEKLPTDKPYFAEIKQIRRRRTIDQNSLYWLWLKCLQDETGEDKERLHEYFKARYLGVSTVEVFGVDVQMSASTTKLNTKEMTHYLDRIQQFALADLGIALPNPSDLHWEQFYQKYKGWI